MENAFHLSIVLAVPNFAKIMNVSTWKRNFAYEDPESLTVRGLNSKDLRERLHCIPRMSSRRTGANYLRNMLQNSGMFDNFAVISSKSPI